MRQARILIVEDEGIVALDLRRRVGAMGHVVVGTVATGEAAISRAAELCPDLILMDIRLQTSVDGVTAVQEIRKRFDIPVVYLTAHADEATLQRAMSTEPSGYLLKPFEEQEVRDTIERALDQHRMEGGPLDSEQAHAREQDGQV